MLEDCDFYHMWMVIYTEYQLPGDDFCFYCYDCVYYANIGSNLSARTSMSVIVAWLSPFTDAESIPLIISLANSTITGENSTLIDTWPNDPSGAQAVAESVFNNYCISGIHVQKRHVGKNAWDPSMFNRFLADAATEHTVNVWAY